MENFKTEMKQIFSKYLDKDFVLFVKRTLILTAVLFIIGYSATPVFLKSILVIVVLVCFICVVFIYIFQQLKKLVAEIKDLIVVFKNIFKN